MRTLEPSADVERELVKWAGGGPLRLGVAALVILCLGIGGWSATASLAGAVIGSGRVKVAAERQVVEHPDGGVVAEILAVDGDAVEAGAPLLRLDDQELSAELSVVEGRLFETLARIARLEAERDGRDTLELDAALTAVVDRPEVLELIDGQRALLDARLETERRQDAQLLERQTQIGSQIDGLAAQTTAAEEERRLLELELDAQRRLLERNLIEQSRVYAVERALAEVEGRIGALGSDAAIARGRISELETERLRLGAERRERAIAELREARAESVELAERRRSLLARLSRLVVTSPRDGVVTESAVFALNSVVRAAEPILFVVPSDSALVVEARVPDVSVDQLFVGQPARVLLPALNARTTPELSGVVTRISADAVLDERTGEAFYEVEIALSDAELARLGEARLTPGMPVDVFLATGERTALSYLLRPFTDYFDRAFRED